MQVNLFVGTKLSKCHAFRVSDKPMRLKFCVELTIENLAFVQSHEPLNEIVKLYWQPTILLILSNRKILFPIHILVV